MEEWEKDYILQCDVGLSKAAWRGFIWLLLAAIVILLSFILSSDEAVRELGQWARYRLLLMIGAIPFIIKSVRWGVKETERINYLKEEILKKEGKI